MRQLPRGTVTLLFTDIEGSTRLLYELGRDPYGETLREHKRLLREVWERHRGYEVDTEGDAFFAAFAQASDPFALGERIAKATGSTSPVRHSS
jgi:class 3 adenylate cyclase